MSASGCRASENFDISSENFIFIFFDAGQVSILGYFKACTYVWEIIKYIVFACVIWNSDTL